VRNVGTLSWHDDILSLLWPSVSVFDPDGEFPLDLARNSFEPWVWPNSESLLQDVASSIFAELVVRDDAVHPESFDIRFREIHSNLTLGPWMLTQAGVCPLDPLFISKLGIRAIKLYEDRTIVGHNRGYDVLARRLEAGEAIILCGPDFPPGSSSRKISTLVSRVLEQVSAVERTMVFESRSELNPSGTINPDIVKGLIRSHQSAGNPSLIFIGTWFLKEANSLSESNLLGNLWTLMFGHRPMPWEDVERKAWVDSAEATFHEHLKLAAQPRGAENIRHL
jgi:hypothetical protein